MSRTVIVGGPRCGKSTLAESLRAGGARVFCGDPRSAVKEVRDGVTYLPEGIPFGPDSSLWIVRNWLPLPGPWVLEGHIMARVLRKWLKFATPTANHFPCERIVVFLEHHAEAVVTPGQRAMHKGVLTVWGEIANRFRPIVEYV